MRVLVAMSGGVDSSVAAALLSRAGHEVVGATLKLWGGSSDSGCCSIADVTDARRVADRLGIEHHVFNFSDEFDRDVVEPYVQAHASGLTPNPCVECNRHLKFGALAERARRLGFDALATGHHARVREDDAGHRSLARAVDVAKDQSYVLAVLAPGELDYLLLPVGEIEKSEVRSIAASLGLGVADKPDSQDVCFITSRTKKAGRADFLAERIEMHPGEVVDQTGRTIGEVPAIELVTIGQRQGLPASSNGARFVTAVDVGSRKVHVGGRDDLLTDRVALGQITRLDGALFVGAPVLAQTSAHGTTTSGTFYDDEVIFDEPTRRVAPGQLVALYREDVVIGSGVAR